MDESLGQAWGFEYVTVHLILCYSLYDLLVSSFGNIKPERFPKGKQWKYSWWKIYCLLFLCVTVLIHLNMYLSYFSRELDLVLLPQFQAVVEYL